MARAAAMAALGAVLGAAALALIVAAGGGIRSGFDAEPPRLVSGLYPVERDPASGLTFAWTGRDMAIRLPGLDRRRDWTLELRARSGRSGATPEPELTFYADGLLVASHRSTAAFETIRITIPARPQRPRGALIRMEVSATIVPGPGDARSLGVMLDDIAVMPAGVVWPPLRAVIDSGAGAAALGGALGLLAGWPAAATATALLAAGQGAIVARGFAPYAGYPDAAAALAVWIAAGLALAAIWMRRRGAGPAARFVAAFSAGTLLLKLLVLLHPEMPVGDAMFHAHRFQGVLAGNLFFTSIAPGGYTFPYPPGFYLFAAPFAPLVARGAADMTVLRIVALTVDAVAGGLIYVAVRRHWAGAWTAAAAVVFYQMVPLEFRVFTVGNLTNAFAQSMAVIALVVLSAAPVDRAWNRYVALLTAALAVAFMSHTSTFPLLFAACLAIAALLRWKGDPADRRASLAILVAAVAALVLAVALYYAHFGETYRTELTRIGTETAAAAPDAGGRSVADRARSVPMYLRIYFGPAALLLAAAGGWGLYRQGARDRLTLALAGWMLSCAAFLALGVLTPVDMRYYLASVPALAIAGAAGTTLLWRARWPGRIAATVLVAAAGAAGIATWWRTF